MQGSPDKDPEATRASRNGIPLEIVPKVILWHRDLKTTRAYLGEDQRDGSDPVGWIFSMEGERLKS